MSSGQYCLIRDLGLVKGGKGMRHHEVVLALSWRGVVRFLLELVREIRRDPAGDVKIELGGQQAGASTAVEQVRPH